MNTETNPAGTMARLQAAEAELQRLREQEPVTWRYVYEDPFGSGLNVVSMNPRLNGCQPKASEPLYLAPVPPPDVRELVEAAFREGFDSGMGSAQAAAAWEGTWSQDAAWSESEALAKFRGQS